MTPKSKHLRQAEKHLMNWCELMSLRLLLRAKGFFVEMRYTR